MHSTCAAALPDFEEALLGFRRRDARERADLGVRELAASERPGQQRNVPSARATRTRSRAAPRSSPPHHQAPGGAGAE